MEQAGEDGLNSGNNVNKTALYFDTSLNATTGGEEAKEVHAIPKNKAENRLN